LTKEKLENEIRSVVRSLFPNADIDVSQYIQANLQETMSGVKGENAIKIFGDDYYKLDSLAEIIAKKIKGISGFQDVSIVRELGQPYLRIEVDRFKASMFGLSIDDIMKSISVTLAGLQVSEVIEGDKRFPIIVLGPIEYNKDLNKIKSIPLITKQGYFVPLIKFSINSRDVIGTIVKGQKAIRDIKLPEGYYVVWSGQFEEFSRTIRRLSISGLFVIFVLFLSLFIFNRSLINTLIVMSSILFAAFGGILSLFLARQPISVSAIVGFISIIGISILNVSFEEGVRNNEAIKQAMIKKFRAVLASSITASLGLLPTALSKGIGTQVQKPLAIVVVGGMFISAICILLFMPVLLRYVEVPNYEI